MPLMAKILIVEDQSIVAMDIQNRLKGLNYIVTGTASSGAGAVKKAEETSPDLVLMDIMLKGDMDGVQAAEEIRYRFGIPVVYLTAYADSNTLQRARVTEPFGYLLKPFQERELHSTIEMALYRHKMEEEIKKREAWFYTTLRAIDEGIITTDKKGYITFINPKAEKITGLHSRNCIKEKIINVLNIENKNIVFDEAFLEVNADKANHQMHLKTKANNLIEISLKVNKITNEDLETSGYVITFNEKPTTTSLEKSASKEDFYKINNLLTSLTVNLSIFQEKSDNDQLSISLLDESEDSISKISKIIKSYL